MTTKGNPSVFYLPQGQTIYQKCLIDILIQLHKPHILSFLKKESEAKSTGSLSSSPDASGPRKSQSPDLITKQQEEGTMSDESMFDAFIFNTKQIINHPSLLVDHYIPKNLLLLNSKENIFGLSNKYYQVSEILDKLVERDARKTIIISVSNAKEMDLIESILLGKRGLQYYRFSGSSLYYDNHGSFDFHKDEENGILTETSSPSSSESSNNHANNNENSKKKTAGRSKKSSHLHNSYNPHDDSGLRSNNGNSTSYSGDKKEKKKKKKGGRPSSAEKRAREQHAQVTAAIAAVNGDKEGTPNHKIRDNKEEYIPRLSKHNEEFCKMLLEKKNKKLNVYLILSSQLKYLLQFEDLKSDLILSLDSNFTDFEELSNILHHQVPILKPVVLESIEHYEWELNCDDHAVFSDNSKRNKSRRSRTTGNNVNGSINTNDGLLTSKSNVMSRENSSEDKFNFNRLLVLSVIAAWPNVEIESPFTIQSVSDKIVDWLVDPNKYSYPFEPTIETKIPHVFDESLIGKVKEALSLNYDLPCTLGLQNIDKYAFFNNKLEEDINQVKYEEIESGDSNMFGQLVMVKKESETQQKVQNGAKRIKPSPDNFSFNFTYRQYQFHLTNLISDNLQAMLSWANNIRRQLDFVHLDETERQFVIDKGNSECGELYKKDRDLGVKIEARDKVKNRLISEYEKLKSLADGDSNTRLGLKERYNLYSGNEDIESSTDAQRQDDEIQNLKEKLGQLQASLSKCDDESYSIRRKYQETSSRAAELSAVAKRLQEEGKRLEEESKGLFKKIELESIVEKQKYINRRIQEMENDCHVWNGYLKVLQVEVEKRSNGVGTSRTSRVSRNNTPH